MSEQALTVQSPHLMPAMRIADAIHRYNALVAYVKELMKDGVDYGAVPGTDKPTLLKPGAEKLTTFFGLTPRFTTIKECEDWTGAQNGGEPFFYYWFRCHLYRGDTLVAEADGSCNSRESKYRWRWVSEEDIPPGWDKDKLKVRKGTVTEFMFAIDKAETGGKYGKPAEYWQQFDDAMKAGTARAVTRKTRSGKELPAKEIDVILYRVPNEDIFSQVNTIQKMAEKRALVAATLLAVNASEFFTQDVEDLDTADFVDATYTVSNGVQAEPKSEPEQEPPQEHTNGNGHQYAEKSDRAKAMFQAVNARTNGYYNATSHMLNAIRVEADDNDWLWPELDDEKAWEQAYNLALAHSRKNK